jgi:hypothetical protein
LVYLVVMVITNDNYQSTLVSPFAGPVVLARHVVLTMSPDPEIVAQRLGIEVRLADLPKTLWGCTVGTKQIVINAGLSRPRQRFAFTHEIAHILVRLGSVQVCLGDDEEMFADEFAREFLVLGASISDHTDYPEVETWVFTWDRLSKLTSQHAERVGDIVVCSRCGPRRRSWGCKCSRERSEGAKLLGY